MASIGRKETLVSKLSFNLLFDSKFFSGFLPNQNDFLTSRCVP